MAADVVLKIDADTQAFIGKLVQAAQAQKKLVDGAKEHGDALSKVGAYAGGVAQHFAGMVGPLAAVGATTAVIEKAFAGWSDNIEKTKANLRGVGDLIKELQRSGAAPDQVKPMTESIRKANRFLTPEDLAAGVGAYRAPVGMVGASIADTTRAVSSAQMAHAAGEDTTEFLRVYGQLEAAGVSQKLPDLAQSLLRSSGGDEKALGLISQHPEQAESIARLFAAVRPQGRQGAAMARQALGLYSAQNATGDVAEFFNRQRGTLGQGEDRGIYDAARANLARQPGVEEGDLAGQAKEGAELRGATLAAEMTNREAADYRIDHWGQAAESSTRREARQKLRSAHHPGSAWIANLVESATDPLIETDAARAGDTALDTKAVLQTLQGIQANTGTQAAAASDKKMRRKSDNDE